MKNTPPNSVVPVHPYEGPFLWLIAPTYHLFASDGDLAKDEYTGGADYYEALYGIRVSEKKHRAACLTMLFDRIEIAPYDLILPDYTSYESGGDYFHPDLGISMSWNYYSKSDAEIARELISNDQRLERIFLEEPSLPNERDRQMLFLERLILQTRVAIDSRSVILGGRACRRILDRYWELLGQQAALDARSEAKWTLNPTDVDAVGLDLSIPDIDSYAELRQSNELKQYTSGFRTAMATAHQTSDVRSALLSLMREAREKRTLAKRIKGAFEVIGSAANFVGLVPVLGSLASLVGLAADSLSRFTGRKDYSQQWYLLGPKMREIRLEQALDVVTDEKGRPGEFSDT